MSISHYYNFIRYKTETVLSGETVEKFCLRNDIPYNLFQEWYRDTRHKIAPRNLHLSYAGEICIMFFKDFFREIVVGRRDYENLLAMMLEINN